MYNQKKFFWVKLNVFMEARVGILFIETCHFFQSSNERIHFIHFDVIKTKCTAYVLLKTSRVERHENWKNHKKIWQDKMPFKQVLLLDWRIILFFFLSWAKFWFLLSFVLKYWLWLQLQSTVMIWVAKLSFR